MPDIQAHHYLVQDDEAGSSGLEVFDSARDAEMGVGKVEAVKKALFTAKTVTNMKKLITNNYYLLLILVVSTTGCASAGTPIDLIWPTVA